jgi:hypothetical protein
MRPIALAAVLALLLTGCSFSFGGPEAVEQAELEKKVAGLYEADDPDTELTADCEGDLAAEVDATQDCHISGGDQSADVRVVVTDVGDEQVDFEATPFVPADRVAETIKASLADQGITVETVDCADELLGEVDATTTCTAAPAEGEGTIEVVVTSVEGLMVNFNYEVVA